MAVFRFSDRRRRRLRNAFAVVLASAAAVVSVQGASGTVAPLESKRVFLNQVPGIRQPPFSPLTGGYTEDETSNKDNADATILVEEQQDTNSSQFVADNETASDVNITAPVQRHPIKEPGIWPCMDDLDRTLIQISLPVIANFAIAPVVGAVDLFFINRLGNALAVAGQAAANQVYGSVFWLTSFIPSITAIQVSKESALGNQEGVQDAVCRAIFVGVLFAAIGSLFMLASTDKALSSVLKAGAPALEFARPYLKIRGLSFFPSLISIVGFSAFRGQLDTTTPVRISLLANMVHAILTPLCIFSLAMGASGVAMSTLVAEVVSATTYMIMMSQRRLIQMSKIFKMPDLVEVFKLIRGGFALQLRNVAFNLTFMAVTRMTQSIDDKGVAPAAHALAMNTFQVGGIVLLALSVVAQTVVPGAMVQTFDEKSQRMVGGIEHARATVYRLMSWGLILGSLLGSLQIVLLPFILKSTPLQEVRDAARLPAYLASILQSINGLVFIGEGVMTGCGDFFQLSVATALASVGCIATIRTLTPRLGLAGIWWGFGAFNGIRLVCVIIHQLYTGPLAPRREPQLRRRKSMIDKP